MKLDVESLRTLRMVVETGTFTEAGSKLGMTQSAVSWKIKRLEERVGLSLVKRGHEIEATPDGRDLLLYAERILEAHDEAVEHLSRSDLQGVVRLGANEDLRGGKLADVLARFARMYPHIRLDVRVQLSGVVREWLDDGEVDLAVVQILADDVRPDDVELWREPLDWYCGREHWFGGDEVVPIVSFGPGLVYLDPAEEALQRAGVRWQTVLECPMLSGVQAAVEAGLGIAALNTRNVTEEMQPWSYNGQPGAPTAGAQTSGARASSQSAKGSSPGATALVLPELCEVVRTSQEGDPEVLDALRSALTTALVDNRS
jgi:DNA-binding transcriptional LysR family regulator